jgi:hypothetical protein
VYVFVIMCFLYGIRITHDMDEYLNLVFCIFVAECVSPVRTKPKYFTFGDTKFLYTSHKFPNFHLNHWKFNKSCASLQNILM